MTPFAVPRALWIGLAIVLAALCFARVSTVRLEDDNLYLIYASQQASEASAALAEEVITAVQAVAGCDFESWRLQFRERYKSNYLAYTGSQALVQSAFESGTLAQPLARVAALIATKAIYFLVPLGLLVFVALRVGPVELRVAAAAALLLLASADIVAQWLPTFWIVDIDRPLWAMAQIGYSLVLAHDAHSLFGVTPRNATLAAFALIFVLKWQGRNVWAALAIFLIGLLHQTYGGLAVVLFCLAAALSSPAIFASRAVRLLLTLSAVMYLLREQYWGGGSLLLQAGVALVVVVAAQLAFIIVRSEGYGRIRQRLLRGLASQTIALDAAALVIVAVLVTLVCLIGGHFEQDPARKLFFWSDLTIRIWSLIRFPVLAALLYYAAVGIGVREAGRLAGVTKGVVAACVVVSLAALAQGDRAAWPRLKGQIAELDAAPRAAVFQPIAEEAHFYHLLASVAAGELDAAGAAKRLYEGASIECRPPAWVSAGHETVTTDH